MARSLRVCVSLSAAALLIAGASPGLAQEAPADCSVADIPDHPFAGTMNGAGFTITDAAFNPNGWTGINDVGYDAYQLIIGASDPSDVRAEVWVGVIVPQGAAPDGKSFRMLPPDELSGQPEAGPGAPEVQGWSLIAEMLGIDADSVFDLGSLRLELGERAGGILPGRLYFCAPDIGGAAFAGRFEAVFGD